MNKGQGIDAIERSECRLMQSHIKPRLIHPFWAEMTLVNIQPKTGNLEFHKSTITVYAMNRLSSPF